MKSDRWPRQIFILWEHRYSICQRSFKIIKSRHFGVGVSKFAQYDIFTERIYGCNGTVAKPVLMMKY